MRVRVEEAKLSRWVMPGAIYCVGRNYAEHAAELNNPVPGEPVIFTKLPHALRLPEEAGRLAFPEETFHHEAELVVLLGRDVPRGAQAGWESVRAAGLGIDLTRREVQNGLKSKGLPWTIAKSFEGSAIVAPLLPLALFTEPEATSFELAVNGETRQRGDTREMLFKLPVILTHLATLGPLAAGDLIFTGTPKGVGPLKRGDRFTLRLLDPARAWDGTL
jgi:2-keto-4-pentenoate hydratase/2-oxohepta-3-ene-1,7-dioic acid hydratase in catechol pathway